MFDVLTSVFTQLHYWHPLCTPSALVEYVITRVCTFHERLLPFPLSDKKVYIHVHDKYVVYKWCRTIRKPLRGTFPSELRAPFLANHIRWCRSSIRYNEDKCTIVRWSRLHWFHEERLRIQDNSATYIHKSFGFFFSKKYCGLPCSFAIPIRTPDPPAECRDVITTAVAKSWQTWNPNGNVFKKERTEYFGVWGRCTSPKLERRNLFKFDPTHVQHKLKQRKRCCVA